jgi:acetylornithine deacetylase/succinyl-diaminopimelate desuccinylase-like protein
VGIIKGGVKINVVPDHCEAHLDMRLTKGQTVESVLAEMNARLEKAGLSECIEIEYIHGKPAVSTPHDAEIVGVSLDAVERGGQCPHQQRLARIARYFSQR